MACVGATVRPSWVHPTPPGSPHPTPPPLTHPPTPRGQAATPARSTRAGASAARAGWRPGATARSRAAAAAAAASAATRCRPAATPARSRRAGASVARGGWRRAATAQRRAAAAAVQAEAAPAAAAAVAAPAAPRAAAAVAVVPAAPAVVAAAAAPAPAAAAAVGSASAGWPPSLPSPDSTSEASTLAPCLATEASARRRARCGGQRARPNRPGTYIHPDAKRPSPLCRTGCNVLAPGVRGGGTHRMHSPRT